MRITLIGSSQYVEKFKQVGARLAGEGHDVRMPALDTYPGLNELEICEHNLHAIMWADEIHLIWDGRSVGVVLDFGMAFALRKPLVIEYIESKTLKGVMERYANKEMRNGNKRVEA